MFNLFFCGPPQDTVQVCEEAGGGAERAVCTLPGGGGERRPARQRGRQPRADAHPAGPPGPEERPPWSGPRTAGKTAL